MTILYFEKTAGWFPGPEEREFNRKQPLPHGQLAAAMLNMPFSMAPSIGQIHGADAASGYRGYEASTPKERDDAMRARQATGFGGSLKGNLPILAGGLLGAGAGALLGGEPEAAMGGAIAGSALGTIPAYHYAHSIGKANAEEALGKKACWAIEYFEMKEAAVKLPYAGGKTPHNMVLNSVTKAPLQTARAVMGQPAQAISSIGHRLGGEMPPAMAPAKPGEKPGLLATMKTLAQPLLDKMHATKSEPGGAMKLPFSGGVTPQSMVQRSALRHPIQSYNAVKQRPIAAAKSMVGRFVEPRLA